MEERYCRNEEIVNPTVENGGILLQKMRNLKICSRNVWNPTVRMENLKILQ